MWRSTGIQTTELDLSGMSSNNAMFENIHRCAFLQHRCLLAEGFGLANYQNTDAIRRVHECIVVITTGTMDAPESPTRTSTHSVSRSDVSLVEIVCTRRNWTQRSGSAIVNRVVHHQVAEPCTPVAGGQHTEPSTGFGLQSSRGCGCA